jgi:Inorganic pyrophosphatase/exopolyphosphatase
MKTTYVVGHRNPDSDSICSAIGYAYLKNKLGEPAVAARAGSLNAETQYILNYFNEPWPELINDFYPRAKDVMVSSPYRVFQEDTLWKLGQLMKEMDVKSIPVIDENEKLVGMVSVGDLAKRFFDELASLDFSQTGTTFFAVSQVLHANVLWGEKFLHRTLEGRLKVAGSSLEVISRAFKEGDIVLVGDRADVHGLCIDLGVSAVILTSSSPIAAADLKRAEEKGILILQCSHDTYTCARLLNQSIPVKSLMQEKMVTFSPEELLEEIKEKILQSKFRNYPVVENGKIVGLINRGSLVLREPQQVILVDHNERSQAVEGIEYTQILEIVDHHRLGGLQTNEPIFIRQEPVGCTATIIANMFWHRNIEMPQKIAGLLLSALLSDTVLFKSPTCTEKDRETAKRLAEIANLDCEVHGMALLRAGSSLSRQSSAEIIHQDLKEFQIGKYRISVSQVFVMDLEELAKMKDSLQEELEVIRGKEEYDLSLLMVTNIILESTELLVAGKARFIVEHAFEGKQQEEIFHLPGVLSRKKQMIPPLGSAVQELS